MFADTVPATSNNAVGLLVPIPTFPLFATTKLGNPLLFDTYSPYDVLNALFPTTVKLADGTPVPTPTRPFAATTNAFNVLPASTRNAVFPTGDTTCNAASGAVVPIPTFPPIKAAAYLYPLVAWPFTNWLADKLLTSTCNPIAVSPLANAPNVFGSLGLIDWIFKSIPTNFALVACVLRSLSRISTLWPTIVPVELLFTVDITCTPDIAFAVPIVNWLFVLSQLMFATELKLPSPSKYANRPGVPLNTDEILIGVAVLGFMNFKSPLLSTNTTPCVLLLFGVPTFDKYIVPLPNTKSSLIFIVALTFTVPVPLIVNVFPAFIVPTVIVPLTVKFPDTNVFPDTSNSTVGELTFTPTFASLAIPVAFTVVNDAVATCNVPIINTLFALTTLATNRFTVTVPLMLTPPVITNRLAVTPNASTFPVIDRLPALISPDTANATVGLLVPIPTFPPKKIPAYRLPVVPATFTFNPTAVAVEASVNDVILILTPAPCATVADELSPNLDPA